VLILFDASGSMGDNGKIDQAKAAARSVLGKVGSDTEVGLIVFYDCGSIVVEQEFTTDVQTILTRIESIQPSGSTPLADAISLAKDYIRRNASSPGARLVILSDGEETCGGDPAGAAQTG
jgi:Mg-chelatase subunit ChlD